MWCATMAVEEYDIEWLQEQIYDLVSEVRDLQNKLDQLQMEKDLLQNDLNTIKMEGCWRFVEDPTHTHRRKNE
jgi:uncharacterized protein YlxW (UPF0749 family)